MITAVILTICIAVATFILLSEPTLIVPDFVNQKVSVVSDWADENNLSSEQVTYEYVYDDEVEVNYVIAQSIEADQEFKDLLSITVSRGPDPEFEVELIDFTDLSEEEIRAFFDENYFTDVTYEYTPDEDIAQGYFIKLNIEETLVARNTLIVVTLSAGSAEDGIEITMPDFTNSSKTEIDAWAQTNYITVNYTYVYSSTYAEGSVISFSPDADSTIITGGSIEVTLSLGAGVTLTNLVGYNIDEAIEWIGSSNLYYQKIEIYSSSTIGNITSMSPSSGSIVAEGTTVTIYVSVGLVPIDNYVGLSKTSFDTWINTMNLKYSSSASLTVSYTEVENDLTAGLIVSMSFDGSTYTSSSESGKYAQPGDTITLVVSKGPSITVTSNTNITESAFITYINGLGLNAVKGTSQYSDSIASGNVISHDTGTYSSGGYVNYVVSLGSYSPSASDFTGKSTSSITSTLTSANNLGAGGWTYSTSSEEYSDTVTSGLTFDCSISSKVVSCKVSKGEEPKPVEVASYAGQSKTVFTTFLANNGLTGSYTSAYSDSVAAGYIISNDTGSFEIGSTVNYVVSLGKQVTDATITNLALKINGYTDASTSKTTIETYLTGLGFTNVTVVIVDSDVAVAQIVGDYPAPGTYSLDTAFYIEISNGNGQI